MTHFFSRWYFKIWLLEKTGVQFFIIYVFIIRFISFIYIIYVFQDQSSGVNRFQNVFFIAIFTRFNTRNNLYDF